MNFSVTKRVLAASVLGLTALLTPASEAAHAQWITHETGSKASFRGLSVLSDTSAWVSGTNGTFMWTVDGGKNWNVDTVAGATSFDFRDVHAISIDTVFLMSSGQDTARIYKTTDRGKTWVLQYNDVRKGVFLNAISFASSKNGLALGDPIAESGSSGGSTKFMVLRTEDGGSKWTQISGDALPDAAPNEVAFAASGTALTTFGQKSAWFVTGGASSSRIYSSNDGGKNWKVADIPVKAAVQSRGAFSVHFWAQDSGIVVGGDYAKPDSVSVTSTYTYDGGKTWSKSTPSAASGYLSGVTSVSSDGFRFLIAVGTKGTSVSLDLGKTWLRLHTAELNAVAVAPNGGVFWAVGPKGVVVTCKIETCIGKKEKE